MLKLKKEESYLLIATIPFSKKRMVLHQLELFSLYTEKQRVLLQNALVWVHLPHKESDTVSARKRFAFEEVFYIQINRAQEKKIYREKKSYEVLVDQNDIQSFIKRFPFTTTKGQENAISDILKDFQKPYPMSRLLEGDVGSGKTAIAATAVYSIIKNRPRKQNFGALQVAYMAPTEILATQH